MSTPVSNLTVKLVVYGQRSTAKICKLLVHMSREFRLEPLPDGMWCFWLKNDNVHDAVQPPEGHVLVRLVGCTPERVSGYWLLLPVAEFHNGSHLDVKAFGPVAGWSEFPAFVGVDDEGFTNSLSQEKHDSLDEAGVRVFFRDSDTGEVKYLIRHRDLDQLLRV